MNYLPYISIVVPCFNEEKNIPLLTGSLKATLKEVTIEIILVDDGSTDDTEIVCRRLSVEFPDVFYIRLSRNFGHQAALKAGIDHAHGHAVVTIDADMQHPPALIPDMVSAWQQGAEIVEAVRKDNRNSSFLKTKLSRAYYSFLGWISEYPVVKGVSDFRLIDRKIADIIKNTNEQHLYLRGLFSWMGFKHAYLPYMPEKRKFGKSAYTPAKMMKLALAGITSMSIKPLRLSLLAGALVSLAAFIYMIYILIIAIFTGAVITGWASTIVSVLFLAGIQLFVLGIIGEYLGKLFMETKHRKNYFVAGSSLGEARGKTKLDRSNDKTNQKRRAET